MIARYALHLPFWKALLGAPVQKNELRIPETMETRFVYNGSTAFDLLLKAARAGGKKILVPRLTCSYVHDVIADNGAIPLYVDFNNKTAPDASDYLNACGKEIPELVLVISYFGIASDVIPALRAALPETTLYIKDCALSYGATLSGKPDGSDADAAFYSFGEGKPLFAAGGGLMAYTRAFAFSRNISAAPFITKCKSLYRYLVKSFIVQNRRLYGWFRSLKTKQNMLSPGSGKVQHAWVAPEFVLRLLKAKHPSFASDILKNNQTLASWKEEFIRYGVQVHWDKEGNGMYTLLLLPDTMNRYPLMNYLLGKGVEAVIPYYEYFTSAEAINWLLVPSMQSMTTAEEVYVKNLLLQYFKNGGPQ